MLPGTGKGPPGPCKGKAKGPSKPQRTLDETLPSEEEQVFLKRFGFDRRTAVFSGSYKLMAHCTGNVASCREGTYTFDAVEGTLIDELGTAVGTFSSASLLDEIDVAVFSSNADRELACIEVVSSEIMREIHAPHNEGAVFVLPSQMNGAEYPSEHGVVTDIDAYKFDNTGGPRGQLAVHPAAGQFILDNASCSRRELGISSIDQVLQHANEDIKRHGYTGAKSLFRLINGYLKLPQPDTSLAATTTLAALQSHVHLTRPILMSNIPASGLRPDKADFAESRHSVSLIYASAVPINSYVNGIGVVSKDFGDEDVQEFQLACAEAFLVAQYLSALSVAASLPGETPRTVFLMPLGGGAFRNPWVRIVRAMSLAVELLREDLHCRVKIKALAFEHGTAGKSDTTPERVKLSELLRSHRKLYGPGFDE